MKKSLNKCWFQAGLACLILTASTGVGYAQYQFTFDTTAQGFSGNAFPPSRSAMAITWSAANQSPLSGSGGGIQGAGLLGGANTWTMAQNYNNNSTNVTAANAFKFDLKVDSSTPLDTLNAYGNARIWFQWGVGSAGDNSGNSVPYDLPLIVDNNWHTYVISAQTLVGTPNFSAFTFLHTTSIGLADSNYGATPVTVTADWDNIAFVPEPSSLLMLIGGLGALGLRTYRKGLSR
jgi:hypothetical protein